MEVLHLNYMLPRAMNTLMRNLETVGIYGQNFIIEIQVANCLNSCSLSPLSYTHAHAREYESYTHNGQHMLLKPGLPHVVQLTNESNSS